MKAARFVCGDIFLCGGKTPFGSTMAHMVACGFGDNEVIVTPPPFPRWEAYAPGRAPYTKRRFLCLHFNALRVARQRDERRLTLQDHSSSEDEGNFGTV